MLSVRSAAVRRATVLALACAWLTPAAAVDGASAFAGRTLADAIGLLRDRGLDILSSTALVRPDMVVATEPTATAPRAILDEILAPHGLAAREGPGGRLVVVAAPPPAAARAAIRGRVLTDGDPALRETVAVRLEPGGRTARVDADGGFGFDGVPPGRAILRTSSPAFRPAEIELTVTAGATADIELRLLPRSVFLNEIVVTPSHFRILDEEPESRMFLSRDEVDQMPHVADDLYRAVKRLPGAASGDISARFHVRGGVDDETLVMLDGVELIEPFHLKDFQSVFSTLDAEAVGGVEFLTGGFPVEYGDRMSGVMDISLATPSGPPATSLAVGTLNSRILSEGTFDDGGGHWLVSGRAWYPDAFLDGLGATREDILTDYADLVATVGHGVGDRTTASVNLLVADDDLGFRVVDPDETEDVAAVSRTGHLWLKLATAWTPTLFSRTVASAGRVRSDRTGLVDDLAEGSIEVDDDRRFEVAALRQDWTFEIGGRQLLKWGVDIQHQRVEYDYLRRIVEPGDDGPPEVDDTVVRLDRRGESYGLYAADRIRVSPRLTAELGLRWDKQFWIDDQQLSPRVNLRLDASPDTTVRAAWGVFHQAQRLYELPVEDGVTAFDPAQRAEHILASVEHRLRGGTTFRIEGYHKRFADLRPRYENLFNPIELFPEARDDRVRIAPDAGRAQGVELLVKSAGTGRLTWWLAGEVSRAEDEIDGDWVARSWDQRRAASFGVNLALPRRWNVNLAGTFHTGWPTTPVTGEVVDPGGDEPDVDPVLGPRNSARYPDYWRLDLRVSKGFELALGELTVILEALNLTDRRNICCVEDVGFEVGDDGTVETVPEYGTWAPLVPSMSVRWTF